MLHQRRFVYWRAPFWTQVNGRVPFCVYYDSKEVSISVLYVSATMAINNLFIYGLGATPISMYTSQPSSWRHSRFVVRRPGDTADL